MAELGLASNLERKLHTCQVLLWLKQTYRVQDGGTQDFVLSKEAVYQTYLAMVTRQQAGGFTFSRPVLGKMVKRAFPTVPSIRRGPRGRVKQLYVGLIPRLIKTEGPLSTSQTAGGVLNLQQLEEEEEDDEAELVSYQPPTGYTDEEVIEEEAAARRRASFTTTTTTTATSSSFTTSSSSSSASSTNHRRGSVETTSTSTSSSTSSYSSPYSPLTGPDTSPPCLEQRRGSLTAAAATTSAATGCEDGAVETLSRCWFGDKATAPEITEASAEDYQLALLVDALTTQQQPVLGRRSPERRGRRLSVVEWAEAIIPAGLQLPTASPLL